MIHVTVMKIENINYERVKGKTTRPLRWPRLENYNCIKYLSSDTKLIHLCIIPSVPFDKNNYLRVLCTTVDIPCILSL